MKHFFGHTLFLDSRHVDVLSGRIAIYEVDQDYIFSGENDFLDTNFNIDPVKVSKLTNNEVMIFLVDEIENDFSCFFLVKAENKLKAISLVCEELSNGNYKEIVKL